MNILIYPPTIDWGFMKQRPQQLMQNFAKQGYTVFYCNKTQQDREIEEIAPNLYLVHHHDNWLNDTLPNVRKEKGCKVGVWCSWAMLAKELKVYKADWIIYDCVDEFADWIKYEKEMIEIADAVSCTAERLYFRLKKEYPHKKIDLIRNAYDESMGLHIPSRHSLPPKKIIGYIGAWAPWVDDHLIIRLAHEFKDCEIKIIGVEFGKKFSLDHLPNVTFLGHLPHHELASHLKQMAICIIPFKLTSVTLATNPVKMYEYLATGKPVVSTALPECLLVKDLVDVGRSYSEFISKVHSRLKDPGDSSIRKKYALSNTWSHRVNQAITLINNLH
ncbi:glycosyltransferase family 1 protein [Bacillus sp. RO2]|uniref:glycosyltransferase n=1 Tax=Bacillus sp. RO2 TaxID=2723913 RepID=UPI00145DBBAF|nr:glycosyltransferase family 1 protein [Bacillus sp. RO2]